MKFPTSVKVIIMYLYSAMYIYLPVELKTHSGGFSRKANRQTWAVLGDGNCFFRCLTLSLYGTEKNHYMVRSLGEIRELEPKQV